MNEFTRDELIKEFEDCINYAGGLEWNFRNAIKQLKEYGTFDSSEILYQLSLFDHLQLLVKLVNEKQE